VINGLTALIIGLDQRIELQFAGLLLLWVIVHGRNAFAAVRPLLSIGCLFIVGLYLALNAAVMLIDPRHVAENWPAASLRAFLYYVMFMLTVTIARHRHDVPDSAFRVLEWLFLVKFLFIIYEITHFLQTGTTRESPLFNIVIASDSLLGLRFTSSYDFLFALLAFARKHQLRRLLLLSVIILVSETRAVFLLSILFLLWSLAGGGRALRLILAGAIPALLGVMAVNLLSDTTGQQTRLLSVQGSSLSDKLEQVEVMAEQIRPAYLLTGRGLGAQLGNLVRDEKRPYSYEAQAAVLLYQGGILFFLMHVGVTLAYAGRQSFVSLIFIFSFSLLNPTLFSLAAAWFIASFATCRGQEVPWDGRRVTKPVNGPAKAVHP
jgi:hypothetical protein